MPSSVIDSRNYGNFPNKPRTVQGTAIYDINSPDSRVVPALTPSFAITSLAAAVECTEQRLVPSRIRECHDTRACECGWRCGDSRSDRHSKFPG